MKNVIFTMVLVLGFLGCEEGSTGSASNAVQNPVTAPSVVEVPYGKFSVKIANVDTMSVIVRIVPYNQDGTWDLSRQIFTYLYPDLNTTTEYSYNVTEKCVIQFTMPTNSHSLYTVFKNDILLFEKSNAVSVVINAYDLSKPQNP